MWAVLFSGQGAQYPGMGQALYQNFALVRELFEQASDTLSVDFCKLCFDSSAEELALTENTQVSLLVVGVSAFRVCTEQLGLKTNQCIGFAGHSVGEYAALVAAGALDFEHALSCTRMRGRFMQQASPVGHGGMAALIGPKNISRDIHKTALEICKQAQKKLNKRPLEVANLNSPNQCVISGLQSLIAEAKSLAPAMRLRFVPLKVSAPFHCSLMQVAEDQMRGLLEQTPFKNAAPGPVVQNLNAQAVTKAQELRQNLVQQITRTVMWTDSIMRLKKMGATHFVECGDARTLQSLNKQIVPDSATFTTRSKEDWSSLEKLFQKSVA